MLFSRFYPYKFLIFLFIFTTTIAFVPAIAESDHSDSSSSLRRRADKDTIGAKRTDLFSKAFNLPGSFIEERYGNELPKALDALDNGDETEIAKILSEVGGTLNDKQIKEMAKLVEKRLDVELGRNPIDADEMRLLTRMLWSAQILLNPDGKPKSESYENFRKAFDKAMAQVDDDNSKFYEILEKADQGDENAKKFIRTQYDPSALLSFIDGQRNSGNVKLADKIVRALSFTSGGDSFVDLNKGSSSFRVFTDEKTNQISSALNDFFESEGGFDGFSANRSAHEGTPDRVFRPKRRTPNENNSEGSGETKIDEKNGPAPDDKRPKDEDSDKTTNKLPDNEQTVRNIFKTKCLKCHRSGKSGSPSLLMNENGTPNALIDGEVVQGTRNKEVIQRILDRAVENSNDPMPPSGHINAELRVEIRKWAKDQGVTSP